MKAERAVSPDGVVQHVGQLHHRAVVGGVLPAGYIRENQPPPMIRSAEILDDHFVIPPETVLQYIEIGQKGEQDRRQKEPGGGSLKRSPDHGSHRLGRGTLHRLEKIFIGLHRFFDAEMSKNRGSIHAMPIPVP